MNLLEKGIPYKSIIMRCDSINRNAFSSKITLKKRILVHVVHGFQIKEKELFRYFIGLQLFQRIEIGDALVC